jgi:hypothetical protein
MKFTLITKNGKIYTFNILACAEAFQQAYGGSLVSDEIFADNYAEI